MKPGSLRKLIVQHYREHDERFRMMGMKQDSAVQEMRRKDRKYRRLGLIISVPLIVLLCVQLYFLVEFTRLHGRLPNGGGELVNWIFGWG